MDSFEKTKAHERTWLPVEALEPHPDNPNEMSSREFDLLVENIGTKGCTEDIEVRQIAEADSTHPHGRFRIMSGHHRWEACKFLSWAEVPVVINRDPELTDEKETAQLVRMNVIKGKLDPEKFVKIYERLSQKYSDEVIQDMLGFADAKEFQRLIKQTAQALPKDLRKKFEDAAKEVKTLEELAEVLNKLLSDYGDTLVFGYMIFDFNGKESIWLRMQEKTLKDFRRLGDLCHEHDRALDDILAHAVQLIASDESWLEAVLAGTGPVDHKLPNHVPPTLDNMTMYGKA